MGICLPLEPIRFFVGAYGIRPSAFLNVTRFFGGNGDRGAWRQGGDGDRYVRQKNRTERAIPCCADTGRECVLTNSGRYETINRDRRDDDESGNSSHVQRRKPVLRSSPLLIRPVFNPPAGSSLLYRHGFFRSRLFSKSHGIPGHGVS